MRHLLVFHRNGVSVNTRLCRSVRRDDVTTSRAVLATTDHAQSCHSDTVSKLFESSYFSHLVEITFIFTTLSVYDEALLTVYGVGSTLQREVLPFACHAGQTRWTAAIYKPQIMLVTNTALETQCWQKRRISLMFRLVQVKLIRLH